MSESKYVDGPCNKCQKHTAAKDAFFFYRIRYCTDCFVKMYPSTRFSVPPRRDGEPCKICGAIDWHACVKPPDVAVVYGDEPSPLQSVITWIPVSERLPEKAGPMDTTYLCCDADNRSVSHCVWLSEIEKWHDGEHCIEPDEFTHWTEIELPTPPASDEPERAPDCTCAGPVGVPHQPDCAFWNWCLNQGVHR